MKDKQNNEINKDFFVSLAPHIRSNDTVTKIMLDVIIALVPILAGSIYFFGFNAIRLVLTCVISCVAGEYIFQKFLHKEPSINDLSAVVTGLLLAFNLPATMPTWMACFGSLFAVIIIKGCFGGIGFNFMNPALGARIMLMTSWAKDITNYTNPTGFSSAVDAVSSATPLSLIKAGEYAKLPALSDMFIGNIAGVIGETSSLLILVGFIYLLARKVIRADVPIIYVATTAVFLLVFGVPFNYLAYELLAGGLLFGAVFMATDYTTTPITRKGKVIFAIGCGLITAVIRTKAAIPEGTSYAICLMNIATPLIDRMTKTQAYGEALK